MRLFQGGMMVKKGFILILLLGVGSLTNANSGQPNEQNLIKSIEINKNMVRVIANPTFAKTYLKQHFFAKYDDSIDLSKLDYSIVTIPFIMNVIPMVWVSDNVYYIDSMDKDLFNSLNTIQKVFQAFYPTKKWAGKLIPKTLIDNSKKMKKSDAISVLFSHGLDAVYTSFHNRDKKQILVTIGGGDINLFKHNMWENVQKQCKEFAKKNGHTNAFVKSNFMTFRKYKHLNTLSPEIKNWFGETSQSLSYTGLAAPIAYSKGSPQLLIASTRTSDFPYPYGTHPTIDNNIAYAGVTIDHDGPEVNRLDKIREIAAIAKENNLSKPLLRVCWGKDPNGGNCNSCEKCLRTIVELLVENQVPEEYGFKIPLNEAIIHARKKSPGAEKLKPGLMWHWGCIQHAAQQTLANAQTFLNNNLKEFLQWISSLDLNKYKKETKNYFEQQRETLATLWKHSVARTFSIQDLVIIDAQNNMQPKTLK